ncbi:hypothetical protein DHEL01_v204340 [Diaporthe helianthi]|uniref:Uncharacterized protein n=1 Tax=Diaporthe helianthi TaxID=158607 RepID=A0A2P5I437_DIAHE|nr:hypothetical protein DHEL01_v204340 [Diaporthe helianthi]
MKFQAPDCPPCALILSVARTKPWPPCPCQPFSGLTSLPTQEASPGKRPLGQPELEARRAPTSEELQTSNCPAALQVLIMYRAAWPTMYSSRQYGVLRCMVSEYLST